MSLTSAVQKAKDAAAHAKPFLKLMDAFAELDGELRAAAQLQTDAEAAAKKKADLEAQIPSLTGIRDNLGSAVNALKSELTSKQAAFDKSLAEQQKAATAALAAKHVEIQAEHDKRIISKKDEIAALEIERSSLSKQIVNMQSQIVGLRKSFENAHAALHA